MLLVKYGGTWKESAHLPLPARNASLDRSIDARISFWICGFGKMYVRVCLVTVSIAGIRASIPSGGFLSSWRVGGVFVFLQAPNPHLFN